MIASEEIQRAEELIAKMEFVTDSKMIGSASYMPEAAEDVDYLLLVKGNAIALGGAMESVGGWENCSDYEGVPENESLWTAIRKGFLNLMLTHDKAFFDKFVAATEVCKALKLTEKKDRVMVCQIVREGITADMARKYVEMKGY